jgi:hypothetical protein
MNGSVAFTESSDRAREDKYFVYLDPQPRQKGAVLEKASFTNVEDKSGDAIVA